MTADPRRSVPRTDALLADPRLGAAAERLGRTLVKDVVQAVQQRVRDGELAPGDAADAVLARLSELLRLTLRGSQAQETTLGEELHLLSLYVDVMRARFEERLRVDISAEPGTERALVPQLILQPLVENSIRHGLDASSTSGTIEVRCARANGTLLLEVRDHGRGLTEPPELALRQGIGLSNTAARLAHLYGDSHRLELRNADDGGLRVTVALPLRVAAAPSAPREA
jgi:LytS/YehU family sensor histidine kinase